MKVKHLVLIVNGKHKAEIFKKFLKEPISILQGLRPAGS